MDSCREKIEEIIRKLSFFDGELRDSLLLSADLGLDSLRMVELVLALEEGLDIVIDESDLDPRQIVTLGDIQELGSKYENLKSPAAPST